MTILEKKSEMDFDTHNIGLKEECKKILKKMGVKK